MDTSHSGKPVGLQDLWDVYHNASSLARMERQKASAYLGNFTRSIAEYTGPPELWHNLAMVAARVNRDAELAIVQQALQDYPNDVDLLCDELQMRYTTHWDLVRAGKLWAQLETMDKHITGPYWRFWAYGAIYKATRLGKRSEGLALLDEGLRWVTPEYIADVLRSYRRVLIDSAPDTPIDNIEQYHKETRRQLESKYRLGIAMGVENSYTLATELAVLLQEQAGVMDDCAGEGQPRNYLEEALAALDLAEKLYTGDSNHPIGDIYEHRARILMAQRKYSDALKLLQSLPDADRNDSSIHTMRALAERMLGRTPEALPTSVPPQLASGDARPKPDVDAVNQALELLFADDGEVLLELARRQSEVGAVLRSVVARLGE